MSNGLRIDSASIPPHIQRLMPGAKAEAKVPTEPTFPAPGVLTKHEAKLEREMHNDFEGWCRVQERPFVVIHSRMDRPTTTEKGVADFIVARNGRVAMIEFKLPGKKPTQDQEEFAYKCVAAGVPYKVCFSAEEAIRWTKEKLG